MFLLSNLQVVNGFMTAFKPIGSFVHEFVSFTHQVRVFTHELYINRHNDASLKPDLLYFSRGMYLK